MVNTKGNKDSRIGVYYCNAVGSEKNVRGFQMGPAVRLGEVTQKLEGPFQIYEHE